MDDKMLLDGLFIVIALLFLPIGFRRGLTREVFVTAGLLTGTALAGSWARPWGLDLEEQFDLKDGVGPFAVSAAFMLGGAILFGYVGAASARVDRPVIWSRIGGSLLAVMNGTLLAAFLLRDIERFLADEATLNALEESEIARTLLREFGWVLIGMAALVLLLIVISLISGDRRRRPAATAAVTPTWQVPPPVAKRKRRLGWGRDDGKLEPQARGFNPADGRFEADAPHYSETMPIAPVAPSAWSTDRAQGRTIGNEWLDIARERGDNGQPRDYQPAETPAARCISCGERLSPDDVFCPRCGRARG